MKKLTLFLLTVFMLLQTSAQLGKKLNNTNPGATSSLAGTWVNVTNGQTITLLFYENGSGEFEGEQISWQTANGKLTMKGGGSNMVYSYKLNGNTLTLSGGDLSKPASFTRNGGGNDNEAANNNFNQPSNGAGKDLLGTWTAQNMNFTFMNGGKMTYNDKIMDYSVSGNRLHCENREAGVTVDYEYEISQGHLLLKYNGNIMMLQKKSGAANPAANGNAKTQGSSLFGDWVSQQNEHLSLMQGGRMTLEGYELTYTYDASTITVNAPAGKVVFTYKLSGNSLTVMNNGITSYYTRAGGGSGAGNGNTGNGYGANTGGGSIDPTMVGTWQRMGASGGGYNSNGSSQYSEYFTLNANGTYVYHSESARSAYGTNQYGNEVFRGSAGGDGNDQGTWRVQGNTIIATSQTKGVQYYPFQKRNNKNGDPCLVLDGTEYVTMYQKSPW